LLNEYKTNNENDRNLNHSKNTNSINDLNKNIENISSETIGNWSNKIEIAMNGLSESIQNQHKKQNDFITNSIKANLNEFNVKNNQCHDKLIHFVKNKQNENIKQISNSLQTQEKSMNDFCENIKKYHNEANIPYFNQFSSNLNRVEKENEIHKVFKYEKTGETPLKQNVIYPNKFVETQPFEEIISEFNEQQNNASESNKSRSLSKNGSSRTTKSNSPFFVKEEIKINFTEKELGFRMYAGHKNKNCFVRHCSSDPRVCDNAQIVEIDGIQVIDKSAGYIRTLLATKQRPISIKFKNIISDEGEEENISNISNTVNPKKRKTPDKIAKLDYATPNKKRHKKGSNIMLSPIKGSEREQPQSANMDVDTLSDIE